MTTDNFKILFVQGKNRTNKKNQSPLYCRLTLNALVLFTFTNRKTRGYQLKFTIRYLHTFLNLSS
ncbi:MULTISPECIES: hypothetical protein [Flavobacterium]|uniref:Uncharacterized protein n=1 Tax=Flavobacterium ranwuense TaxID=2541725 RepID=A0ABY2DV14_9FLAO|nr:MULTISPECIES: hypothetical protein [Flavobacterium]TDE31569.1 hypothetical protein E0I61_02385 [Flavobacterium ranwuense]TDE55124.1 hypothetical protein E0H99_02080 [Flavobacterium sp. GT3P67]